jgi:hypothetical protein
VNADFWSGDVCSGRMPSTKFLQRIRRFAAFYGPVKLYRKRELQVLWIFRGMKGSGSEGAFGYVMAEDRAEVCSYVRAQFPYLKLGSVERFRVEVE